MSGRHALPRNSGALAVVLTGTALTDPAAAQTTVAIAADSLGDAEGGTRPARRSGSIQIRAAGKHARPAVVRDMVGAVLLLVVAVVAVVVAVTRVDAGDWQHLVGISFIAAGMAGCSVYILLRTRGREAGQPAAAPQEA